MVTHTKTMGRREEYALATRQAILDAARQLFCSRGYFATKVDEIATRARVAPATVYAVSGGKSGLLRSLVDQWSTAPVVAATLSRIGSMQDPAAIIRFTAEVSRKMREECGDIIRVLLAAAPHDKEVAEGLAVGTARYRQAFVPIAKRLVQLGALRAGLSAEDAVDIFWFYLGYSGLFTLHDDNGWTYEQAEHWLAERTIETMLKPAAVRTAKTGGRKKAQTRG